MVILVIKSYLSLYDTTQTDMLTMTFNVINLECINILEHSKYISIICSIAHDYAIAESFTDYIYTNVVVFVATPDSLHSIKLIHKFH